MGRLVSPCKEDSGSPPGLGSGDCPIATQSSAYSLEGLLIAAGGAWDSSLWELQCQARRVARLQAG